MRTQLAQLVIDKFIVHDIPNKLSSVYLKKNPEQRNLEPDLSDIETPFSDALQTFFHNKISQSIGSTNSFDIEYIDDEQIVPLQIDTFFSESERIIEVSQNIAKQLHHIQDAKNSAGLLLFVICHAAENRVLAILKVEREEGVQIRKEITDGYKHFNMQHIENLMLTQKTRLFKIVLFYKSAGVTKGILSDQQMGFNIGKDVAMYYLNDFLGCKLSTDPSVQTKKFFEITQDFINNSKMNSEEKNSAITHLVSTLTSNLGTVNPQYFAENYLNIEYADDFLAELNGKGITNNAFVKNILLIQNKLKTNEYVFKSGIKVIAPKEEMDEHLSLHNVEGGKTRIEITDSLKKVSAK